MVLDLLHSPITLFQTRLQISSRTYSPWNRRRLAVTLVRSPSFPMYARCLQGIVGCVPLPQLLTLWLSSILQGGMAMMGTPCGIPCARSFATYGIHAGVFGSLFKSQFNPGLPLLSMGNACLYRCRRSSPIKKLGTPTCFPHLQFTWECRRVISDCSQYIIRIDLNLRKDGIMCGMQQEDRHVSLVQMEIPCGTYQRSLHNLHFNDKCVMDVYLAFS